MKTAEEKIFRAKVQLIISEPFFATLLFKLPTVANSIRETMTTDGKSIEFNPKFVEGLTLDEVKAVLCHEVLHVANLHHLRREGRDAERWNKATDYAINPLLIRSGFKLPASALISPEFDNLSAEQIYKLLPDGNGGQGQGEGRQQGGQGKQQQNQQQQPQGGHQGQQQNQRQGQQTPDPGQMGAVQDSPATTKEEIQQQEAEIRQAVAQAAQIAKKAGKLPGHLEELIEEIVNAKVNWKEVLSRYVLEQAKNDYSFTRRNTRYAGKFFLPALYNLEPGKIYLVVDTSGSIDRELLQEFGGEIQGICNEVKATLVVMYVDTKVQKVIEIEPDEDVKLTPIGRGGTDFRPGFEYIEEAGETPRAVIYFTDGECNNFPEPPEMPVLWAKYGSHKFNPPFGEVMPL